MVEVREVDPQDARAAAAWASTVTQAVPFVLATAASVQQHARQHPHALALRDGRVLGVARVRDQTADDGSCGLLLGVLSRERGAGTGSALLRWTLDRAKDRGAERLTGAAEETGDVPAMVRHWGFRLGGRSRISWVDARDVPPSDVLGDRVPSPDLRLVPVADAGPEAVWACHQATITDDPSGFGRQVPLATYVEEEWGDPLLRHDLSHAAVDEAGRVVAFSLLRVAGRRGWSSMTGVHPEHRRRGLSLAVKAATLRAAAGAGVRQCSTGNSAENAAVLALNSRLGYQLQMTIRRVERDVALGLRR
ncbi:MAG TPA: GNAT family N-acetyltransferase [Nocardioides sp.]|nr:GNAT family N-acetyltransferase [Nocardioides sp.]